LAGVDCAGLGALAGGESVEGLDSPGGLGSSGSGPGGDDVSFRMVGVKNIDDSRFPEASVGGDTEVVGFGGHSRLSLISSCAESPVR